MRITLLAILLLALPANAGQVSDLLMKPGILAELGNENLPQYTHQRKLKVTAAPVPAPAPADPTAAPQSAAPQSAPTLKDVTDGGVKISHVPDSDMLQLTLTEAGKSRVVAEFPAQTANPALLFFLENVVRAVAGGTGGNPFYIRGRIRDALVALPEGQQQSDYTEVVIQPFKDDPNAARMGEFVNLTITLRYDPEQPAKLMELLADTGSGSDVYNETMILAGEK